MTPTTPSFEQILEFLAIDGWSRVKKSDDHLHYEKFLADGRVLKTHISHSGKKSPSDYAFGLILRTQLEVSRKEFWGALQTGKSVDRPVPELEPDAGPQHPAWVIAVLAAHHAPDEIEAFTEQGAIDRVYAIWSGAAD